MKSNRQEKNDRRGFPESNADGNQWPSGHRKIGVSAAVARLRDLMANGMTASMAQRLIALEHGLQSGAIQLDELEDLDTLRVTSAPPPPPPGDDDDDLPAFLQSVSKIKSRLLYNVYGQVRAIESICDLLLKHLSGAFVTPVTSMLFVGPDGVGKNLAARTLAETLGDDWASYTLDMSSMLDANNSDELDGNEPSYSNAAPGKLTRFVLGHPKTVIVFDKIERAHPVVLNRLAGLAATGKLRDRYGMDKNGKPDTDGQREIDFSQCILIFITEAGESVYEDQGIGQLMQQRPDLIEQMLLGELARAPSPLSERGALLFSPALLNCFRGGRTVMFERLGHPALLRLAVAAFNDATRAARGSLRCDYSVPSTDGGDGDDGTHDTPSPLSIILDAYLLSLSPSADPATIQARVPQLFMDMIMDRAIDEGRRPKAIVHQVSERARQDFADIRTRLGNAADPVIECERRGLKVEAVQSLDSSDSARWVYTLDSLALRRVTEAEDLQGPGAIRTEVPAISFAQIAGHSYVKRRLAEVVDYLRHPPGAHVPDLPRGMLLYGPPGTGKTMLAKALAHEANLPFIATTGTEMLDPALAKKVFARARRYAPSIVFIDEIDALGRRDDRSGHVQAINQLLAEMDGFDTAQRSTVFVVAATNLPKRIDPALMRAGRMDLHVEIPQLDREARAFFVDKLLKLDNDGSLHRDNLLDLTAGMSGADLEQLRRELALDLLRDTSRPLDQRLVVEQINTIRYGQRTGKPLVEADLDHVAYHEAGHAIISQVLDPDIRITQITIVPRSDYRGMVTLNSDDMDNRRMTREQLMDRLCVFLAGREAQMHRFGADGIDSGASEDLHQATRLAAAAVGDWGFDAELGVFSTPGDNQALQDAAAPLILQRTQALLQQAEQRCRKLVADHWPRIEALALRLRSEEWLHGAQL